MKKYEITFRCVVTVKAKNSEEAIRLAWLSDNQNYNATYKYQGIKEVPSTIAGGGSQ